MKYGQLINRISSVVAAAALIVACNNDGGGSGSGPGPAAPTPPAPGESSDIIGGDDVKAEFLTNYSGSDLVIPSSVNTGDRGLPKGSQSLRINSDGTYALKIENQEIDSEQGKVRCSTNEAGNVTQVQMVKQGAESIQAGGNSYPSSGVQGVIALNPTNIEVVNAAPIIEGEGQQQTNTQAGSEITSRCQNNATRFVLVEAFFPDAFLLAQAEGTDEGFFLQDRLVVRNPDQWVWMTGGLAGKAVSQSQKYLQGKVTGLEIEGDRVNALEARDDATNVSVRVNNAQDSNVNIDFGTTAVETFLPLLNVTGSLRGVSYQPSSGTVVYKLANYQVSPMVPQLDERNRLNLSIQTTLFTAARDMGPHMDKLQGDTTGKLLDVSVNTKKDDRIKLRSVTETPQIPTSLDAPAATPTPDSTQKPGGVRDQSKVEQSSSSPVRI